ncbi:MAG: membrane dipeptidase [Anaerolineales bacterium]|jgi:membrane dipeptidase
MNKPMILVDSHEDLAWNMATFGRNYLNSIEETRQRERNTIIPEVNGDTLLGWPEYQRGRVAIVFGTLFAAPMRTQEGDWDTQCYLESEQAFQLYSRQLDLYQRLVEDHADKFSLIQTRGDLQAVIEAWQQEQASEEGRPVGIVVLMEGAEGVRAPSELEEWWQRGVRIIGPAWRGTRFCGGTREPGPLTKEGFALLEAMASLGFGLDISHMDEAAVLQALDSYPEQILASHANAKALLKGTESNRHLSDRVIQGLLEREAVIGVVPLNSFLKAGWLRGDPRQGIDLQDLVAHIDYICQMAGDARHVGLGSDFDGGFGLQSTPLGIDTIADLQKLVPLLAEKGYDEVDIAAVMGQNWIEMLRRILPTEN